VHKGTPIWVTEGGAELPLTNIAAAVALALTGPGAYSVDRLLGLRPGPWLTPLTAAAVAGATALVFTRPEVQPQQATQATQAEPTREPRAVAAAS
jgi:putative oxidoreductase